MDVIEDIRLTLDDNSLLGLESVKVIMDKLEDYEYDREYVNAPGAYGDTHKYSVTYKIRDYVFEYFHILPEGEIASAEFTVKKKEDNAVLLFKYSLMGTMFKQFNKTGMADNFHMKGNKVFDGFLSDYGLDFGETFYCLTILNAFTFGQCVTLWDDDKELDNTNDIETMKFKVFTLDDGLVIEFHGEN